MSETTNKAKELKRGDDVIAPNGDVVTVWDFTITGWVICIDYEGRWCHIPPEYDLVKFN